MTTSDDLKKHREIVFAKFPPDQVPVAADDLQRMQEIAVQAILDKRAVGIDYQLTDHTLAEIESHLVDQGFHLDNTLMNKLKRALIHYIEETQLHNLDAPEKLTKQVAQDEAYVHAWEHRPHGDHDDTPPEWREYK